MSTVGIENEVKKEEIDDAKSKADNEENLIEVSVREITEQEKDILNKNTSTVCSGGNTHVWKVDGDVCHIFSQLEVVSIAFGSEHCLLLTEDNDLYTHGSNTHGQLGQGDCDTRDGICLVKQLQGTKIRAIACGERHNAVLDGSGILYTWGDSTYGQCGLGAEGIFTVPSRVKFPQTRRVSIDQVNLLDAYQTLVKDISCGEMFSVALDTKGCVWSWGSGCALGHDKTYEITTVPKLVKRLSNKKAISLSCGAYHCIVITQDEFVDDMLNIPSSPDYRAASVSSVYYSELKSKGSIYSSKVPFKQSKVYENNDSPDSTNKHSHSDTDIARKHSVDNLPGVSTSANDILDIQDNHEKPSPDQDPSNISGGADSVTSSQYFSTGDLSIVQSPRSEDTSDKDSIDELERRSSISSKSTSDSADTAEGAIDIENKNKPRKTIEQPDGIFEGKKSFFTDGPSANPVVRIRSQVITNRVSLPTFNSAVSLDDSINNVLFDMSASTQVWTFGKNSYGQLGHGDLEDRFSPTLVKKLNNKGIIKVTAGSYHSLALSSQGKVYSCGDNAFGQLGQIKTIISTPKKIKVLEGIRVWDFAAGRNFSLFLGDSDRNKTDVYFCGDGAEHKNNTSRRRKSISEPIVEVSHLEKKRSSKWRLSSRRKMTDSAPNLIDIQLRKLTHFQERELVRFVTAKDYSFSCISLSYSKEMLMEPIYKFARAERLVYQQLMIIQKVVIEPFISTDSWNSLTKMVAGESLLFLIDSFVDLLNGISTELMNLTEIIRMSLSVQELFSYVFSDSFRGVYERYAKCYADASASGLLQLAVKPCSSIISRRRELMKDLEKQLSLTQATFENLLKVPLLRCHVYCDLAKRLSTHCQEDKESEHFKEVIQRWLFFTESCQVKLNLAHITNSFWNESHAKLIETLKDPQRRVLKSSKTDPLTLARASRLSSHSYILCNDVFVHVQYNRNFQVFPLVTLWVEDECDTEHAHNAIKVLAPEESFVLVAGTPDGKLAWLKELNQAIALSLASSSTQGVDIGSVNSSGLLKAAVAREAQYTYQHHLSYRGATYTGMWMSGEPHGRGRICWEDGTVYEGEFIKGRYEGFGQMTLPKNSMTIVEKFYEGEWKEGRMFGYGRMTYGPNEEYIGHFKDDVRHGHGTFKCSTHKTSLDTVYVGDWVNDVKCGYGVLDYIVRGEKYMGLWSNDQRQGYGVVVTVDGVYYEGKFFQNRLAGRGILLSEDDTCYEGEFTADMLLSGKGILTLPNGDNIDGSFYGNWGDSIKVNGVFSKFSNPMKLTSIPHSSSDMDRLKCTDFTIDADAKWRSLFNECFYQLGCEDLTTVADADPEKAWRKVYEHVLKAAGSLSTMYRSPTARIDIEFIRNNDWKEKIKLAHNLKDLKEFLTQAFDTYGHPLHTLIDGLSEVYRATYVGVGAHRRLLPHAVAEAKSYVARVFNVLRILFPDLHDEDFVLLSNDTVDGYAEPSVNSMSLLHPLLLPRLYPPLFTLYALQTEKTDAAYTEKLYYLNKRGDMALMSFLGIKRDFWLLPQELQSTDKHVFSTSHKAYTEAIESLSEISTIYSPMEKIDVLKRTFSIIHHEIEEHFKGIRKVVAMDDLFPIFQFIVIRTRIPHLGSEIQFIEDMVDQSILRGEAGHMVITLSACYFQIQQERDRD